MSSVLKRVASWVFLTLTAIYGNLLSRYNYYGAPLQKITYYYYRFITLLIPNYIAQVDGYILYDAYGVLGSKYAVFGQTLVKCTFDVQWSFYISEYPFVYQNLKKLGYNELYISYSKNGIQKTIWVNCLTDEMSSVTESNSINQSDAIDNRFETRESIACNSIELE